MISPKILDAVFPEMFTDLEDSNNYTILHLNDGKKLISGYSLNVFDALFKDNSLCEN
jgi:hypothetical protein